MGTVPFVHFWTMGTVPFVHFRTGSGPVLPVRRCAGAHLPWIGLPARPCLSLAGLLAAPTASAATGYTLTADPGTGVTTSASAITLTVSYLHNGAKVARATARLQYLKGSTWTTEKEVTIRKGKGSTRVKHAVGERTYRFSVSGKAVSEEFTVRFVPATFTLNGSGFGHGVGMSQYGAYQMARDGFSTVDIVSYYYPGATVDSANNNARTVKVQVLGPPADSARPPPSRSPSGGFTLTGDGVVLKSSGTPGTVAIGVSGTTVTAKVTLANGTVKNKVLPASRRLTLTWTSGRSPSRARTAATCREPAGDGDRRASQRRQPARHEHRLPLRHRRDAGLVGVDVGQRRPRCGPRRSWPATTSSPRIRACPLPGGAAPIATARSSTTSAARTSSARRRSSGSANRPWIDAVDATILSGSLVQVVRDPSAQIAETPYFASSGSFTAEGTGYSAPPPTRTSSAPPP